MAGLLRALTGFFRRPAPTPSELVFEYSPNADGRPDPGEIVWTWVPYEENDGRGKDRPVLLIARRRRGRMLVGLMLTSKDHGRTARRDGRHWLDIGSGPWDRQSRPSEVRLDRLIEVDPRAVRRRHTALDRARFDRVVEAVRALHASP
ncbi:type II toxin-antitoxin system PemK/MazF family toxin [Spongisporangium articulatum]|uniref:Type II toxin-antitoxin system PemK/MazF family toxin n=1 Tax=Spongisporangium articulatum TaxID=3362603 RepID=A0ABW8AJ20_9ACTN